MLSNLNCPSNSNKPCPRTTTPRRGPHASLSRTARGSSQPLANTSPTNSFPLPSKAALPLSESLPQACFGAAGWTQPAPYLPFRRLSGRLLRQSFELSSTPDLLQAFRGDGKPATGDREAALRVPPSPSPLPFPSPPLERKGRWWREETRGSGPGPGPGSLGAACPSTCRPARASDPPPCACRAAPSLEGGGDPPSPRAGDNAPQRGRRPRSGLRARAPHVGPSVSTPPENAAAASPWLSHSGSWVLRADFAVPLPCTLGMFTHWVYPDLTGGSLWEGACSVHRLHSTESRHGVLPPLRVGSVAAVEVLVFSTAFHAWWGAAWQSEKGRQAKRKSCPVATESMQQLP